ncbi:MAG: hypothetical protein KY466_13565 [Gemmatimonadetes bacterium]|nr:hypothetical protein [Gemmatimonadota bacterium]
MSACLIVLGIIVGCSAGGAEAVVAPRDRWFAEDKIQHFTLSAAATTIGYGGASVALERDAALLAAGVAALGLGVAKEVRDVRAGRSFSLKDLVWDAAGVALALTLVSRIG